MATIDAMTFDLSTETKRAGWVIRLLRPLVMIGLLTVERATSIAMRFVKVTVTPAQR